MSLWGFQTSGGFSGYAQIWFLLKTDDLQFRLQQEAHGCVAGRRRYLLGVSDTWAKPAPPHNIIDKNKINVQYPENEQNPSFFQKNIF